MTLPGTQFYVTIHAKMTLPGSQFYVTIQMQRRQFPVHNFMRPPTFKDDTTWFTNIRPPNIFLTLHRFVLLYPVHKKAATKIDKTNLD